MKIRNKYLAANLVILSLVGIFTILFLVFSYRLDKPAETFKVLLITGLLSLIFIILINKIKSRVLKAVVQTGFVLTFFAFFFGITSDFQLLLFNEWQDNKLLALDKALFGSEASLVMQEIVTPYITEAMMFAYIIYIPLLAIVAFCAYKNGKEEGLAEYLIILSLAYSFCYIGFVLFPVASQMYFMPDKYSTALTGGYFTYLGELIRNQAHFPGGSLPSPHCAASTVMLFILFKYSRASFYLILPTVLILYVSTVYCRFHYLWDAVAGILLALLIIKIFPLFKIIIDMIMTLTRSIMHPVAISESLSEN